MWTVGHPLDLLWEGFFQMASPGFPAPGPLLLVAVGKCLL